jgi:hypothetical protein
MLNQPGWNLEELESYLPNGLHDAEIEVIHYDLMAEFVSIQVFVWVGTMDDPPELRERYRRGLLRFEKVRFFAKRAPSDGSDERLCILTCARNKDLAEEYKASSPFTENCCRLFAGNCEIDIEFGICGFNWMDEEPINRSAEQI